MASDTIVSTQTMNWIVSAIRDHCDVFHDIKPEGRVNLSRIGEALYGMNFAAISPTPANAPQLPAYKFCEPAYVGGGGALARYQAVRELRDRCDTAVVRDTTLFMALHTVYLRLALEVADDHLEPPG